MGTENKGDFISTGKAAEILGMPARTVRKLAKERKLPIAQPIGYAHYRYPRSEIEKLKEFRYQPSHYNVIQQRESGIAEEQKKEVNEQVPTWFPPFAAALREAMCFPDPMRLLIFRNKYGEIYAEDNDGATCGCFYWAQNDQGETIIRLYDYKRDSFLEDNEYYRLSLKLKPVLEKLLEQYKSQAVEYISSVTKLMHTTVTDVERTIFEHFKITSSPSKGSLLSALSSGEPIRLGYIKSLQENMMEIRRRFFETIYWQIIKATGNYPKSRVSNYQVKEDDADTGRVFLLVDSIPIASAPREDMGKIEKIHKDITECKEYMPMAADICQHYERLLEIKDKLFMQL